VEKMLKREAARQNAAQRRAHWESPGVYSGAANLKPNDDLKSQFYDPPGLVTNYYGGGIKTISPYYGRIITPTVLRRVAEKCWLINLCIAHSIRQARPYLKESTGENQRGFRIRNMAAIKAGREMNKKEKDEARQIVEFLLNTGDADDAGRIDDIDKYGTKGIRDIYQLDQIAAELQWTTVGELCGFWAIDPATIEIALPNTNDIKYAQVIDNIPYAFYEKDDLLYDCMNPRTDIRKAGYGYSIVEQCIELVTSTINAYAYNAGFFTENKVPRGMFLLNGDIDEPEMQEIQNWIVDMMSGSPASQHKVPIIPSGINKSSGGGKTIEWIDIQKSNRDMEFTSWTDYNSSGIVAMFGKSMEELGLHSQKSQALFGVDHAPVIEASKSLGLGDLLSFLQKHFNHIVKIKNPAYCFEFVGYEKPDMKMVADIDKAEVDVWKSLNEKRLEKGLDPIDLNAIENPFDIPQSPQAVQLFQGKQQMNAMGGGGDFGEEDEEGEDGGNEGGGSGWDALENEGDEDTDETPDADEAAGDGKEPGSGWDKMAMGKSQGRARMTRFTV
jgi:hypothetical protein